MTENNDNNKDLTPIPQDAAQEIVRQALSAMEQFIINRTDITRQAMIAMMVAKLNEEAEKFVNATKKQMEKIDRDLDNLKLE
jgi:hypothetical protein